eukprot:2849416-Rhodomonas_salina.2
MVTVLCRYATNSNTMYRAPQYAATHRLLAFPTRKTQAREVLPCGTAPTAAELRTRGPVALGVSGIGFEVGFEVRHE